MWVTGEGDGAAHGGGSGGGSSLMVEMIAVSIEVSGTAARRQEGGLRWWKAGNGNPFPFPRLGGNKQLGGIGESLVVVAVEGEEKLRWTQESNPMKK